MNYKLKDNKMIYFINREILLKSCGEIINQKKILTQHCNTVMWQLVSWFYDITIHDEFGTLFSHTEVINIKHCEGY